VLDSGALISANEDGNAAESERVSVVRRDWRGVLLFD